MSLIKCKECGKEISDTASKCIHCGYELDIIKCPECGKNTSKKINSCEYCGYLLKENEKSDKSSEKITNVYMWILAFIPLICVPLFWITWYLLNSFWVSAIFILIIINVMQIILISQDYKNLKNTRKNLEILGKFNPLKIVVPDYIKKRAKIQNDSLKHFTLWIINFVIFIIVWIVGILFETNPLYYINNSINQVKNGYVYSCPNHTMEELISNYMENPKWESLKTPNGTKAVNITGTVTRNGISAKVFLQYFIKDDEFVFNTLEIDNIPQTFDIYNELIDDMCSYNSKNNENNNIDYDNNENTTTTCKINSSSSNNSISTNAATICELLQSGAKNYFMEHSGIEKETVSNLISNGYVSSKKMESLFGNSTCTGFVTKDLSVELSCE